MLLLLRSNWENSVFGAVVCHLATACRVFFLALAVQRSSSEGVSRELLFGNTCERGKPGRALTDPTCG
jgi:hypothetical protein